MNSGEISGISDFGQYPANRPARLFVHRPDSESESSKAQLPLTNGLKPDDEFEGYKVIIYIFLAHALLACGQREAADALLLLIISPTTLKTHLRNIYAKLEVNSRAEAMVKVKALNLFE